MQEACASLVHNKPTLNKGNYSIPAANKGCKVYQKSNCPQFRIPVHTCAYKQVYTCLNIHTFIHTLVTCIHTHIHAYICKHKCIGMHAYIRTYICVCMVVCVCVYLAACMSTNIHTYLKIQIHGSVYVLRFGTHPPPYQVPPRPNP